MIAHQVTPKIASLYGLSRQATEFVWNFATLARLKLFWTIFSLRTLKLDRVVFYSVTFQLKCLDFQCNQYKKLALVHIFTMPCIIILQKIVIKY